MLPLFGLSDLSTSASLLPVLDGDVEDEDGALEAVTEVVACVLELETSDEMASEAVLASGGCGSGEVGSLITGLVTGGPSGVLE